MLYDMIGDAEAEGVVFISGDRHHAELSVMKGPLTYSLYDLTSSGLDLGDGIAPAEFNDHRVSELYAGDNFGLITVDWNLPDPLVTLEVRDDHGKSQIRHETPLSLLHSPPPN